MSNPSLYNESPLSERQMPTPAAGRPIPLPNSIRDKVFSLADELPEKERTEFWALAVKFVRRLKDKSYLPVDKALAFLRRSTMTNEGFFYFMDILGASFVDVFQSVGYEDFRWPTIQVPDGVDIMQPAELDAAISSLPVEAQEDIRAFAKEYGPRAWVKESQSLVPKVPNRILWLLDHSALPPQERTKRLHAALGVDSNPWRDKRNSTSMAQSLAICKLFEVSPSWLLSYANGSRAVLSKSVVSEETVSIYLVMDTAKRIILDRYVRAWIGRDKA